MEIWIVSIILMLTLFLLITEKVSVDIIAVGIIAVLSLTRILSPEEAIAGFANPAVVTVAAMFLISRALIKTGAVGFLHDRVIHFSGGNARIALFLVFLTVAVSSAFINNTPVVVLFIPVLMSMGCKYGFRPSKFLIPLSYVSILAGTCTLIGTSTNILVSDLSAGHGYGAIGMFELSKVGIPIAILGVCFIFATAGKLLPDIVNPTCELENKEHRKYLSQLRVPLDSPLVGINSDRAFQERYSQLELVEVIRHQHIFYPGRDTFRIRPSDLLIIKGEAKEIVRILDENSVVLPQSEMPEELDGTDPEKILVEVIIPPQSAMIGDHIKDVRLFKSNDINILAVERKGLHYTEKRIQDMRLKLGDLLLVQLPWERLEQIRGDADAIMVEDVNEKIVHHQKAPVAGIIFLGVIVFAASGLLDIMVSALTGVFLLLITRCLGIRDAYRALQGNILVLIAGMIALGAAMEKTGASEVYARLFLGVFEGLSPGYVLGAFLLLTSISTQLLSNNATAVLLLPIAISTALEIGVNPTPFIFAVCIGASACFATPIGYQTNLLVYGPGAYRFSDFLKIGIPLNFIVLAVGSILIPYFWPF
jgi:di/tricarboxylate transporter